MSNWFAWQHAPGGGLVPVVFDEHPKDTPTMARDLVAKSLRRVPLGMQQASLAELVVWARAGEPLPSGVRNDPTNPLADLAAVREWALAYIAANPVPDFHVGPDHDHQLQRWFVLPRNPFNNVYLHRFLRSDDDRALHDHPWDNRSWVLSGGYLEHLQDGSVVERREGDVVERRAIEAHRVELTSGPAVTLFFTGPVIRNWGFYCPRGWVPWAEFVTVEEGGNRRGQGCGDA